MVDLVQVTHIFNGDASAADEVNAAALDTQLSNLALGIDAEIIDRQKTVRDGGGLVNQIVGFAALKPEVITSLSGMMFAQNVAVVAQTNIAALTGLQTIDGYTLLAGDRVLLIGQTAQVQNGIYVAASGAWTLAYDSAVSLSTSFAVAVLNGVSGAGTVWRVYTPGVPGSTATTWIPVMGFSALLPITRGGTGANNAAQAIINLGLSTQFPTLAANVAALKAITAPASLTLYRTFGYLSTNDGGDAFYYWNAGDTRADNGGTILQLNAGGVGRWNLIYSGMVNVRWFGARGDGITDDTSPVQAAITYVLSLGTTATGTVFAPTGQYVISSSLTVAGGGGFALVGGGAAATVFLNKIVGAAANPCILCTAAFNQFIFQDFTIQGNGLSGASGNGNAMSFINTVGGATFWPQIVVVRGVIINGHLGTGKDHNNASIPSSAIYGYLGTGFFIEAGTFISNCAIGAYFDSFDKTYLNGATFNSCVNNALWLNSCENVSSVNSIFNGSGSGGATDGAIYSQQCESVTFYGCRFKNANPCLVNTNNAFYNRAFAFYGCNFEQFDPASGHQMAQLGNSMAGVTFDTCSFSWVNTISDGVGISCLQVAAGFNLTGLAVRGCTFWSGNGGTIAAAIKTNIGTNALRGAVIEGNQFGLYNSAATTAITAGILLLGNTESCSIRNNTFVAVTGVTITDCVNIGGAGVSNTILENNNYHALGGTITNTLNNVSGVTSVTFIEGGKIQLGANSSPGGITRTLTGNVVWDPPSIGNGAKSSTTVTVTGAALGDDCSASFSLTIQGMVLGAEVSAANTVTVTLANNTGGAIDLASGTVRAFVKKWTP